MENVRPNPSCKFTVKFQDRVVVKSSGLNACVIKVDKQKGEAVVAVAGKAGLETYKMGQLVFVKSSSVACTSLPQAITTTKRITTAATNCTLSKNAICSACTLKKVYALVSAEHI